MPQRVGHLHLYIDHLPYSPQEIQQIKMEQKAKKRSKQRAKQLQIEHQTIQEEPSSRQELQQQPQQPQQQCHLNSSHSFESQNQPHIQIKPVPQTSSTSKNCYTQSTSSNYLLPPNQYQCQFQPKQTIRSSRNYQASKHQQQQHHHLNNANCTSANKSYSSNSSYSNTNFTNSRSYIAVN